jgi:ABC-type uncharacterized transport system substrate-binding protein
MTLLDYIKQTPEGEEITVWDNTYDIETYFYNQVEDSWDNAMMKLASKLNVVDVQNDGVIVDMYDLIERNIDNPEFEELFIDVDVDTIMEDMQDILAGYVSEEWLVRFVNCLK